MTGRLSGGPSPGGEGIDCSWIEDLNGRRVSVFWPDGWDETFHPVRVYDEQRQLVAREGDVLIVTGPIDGIGDSICSPGSVFMAETVQVVGPANVSPTIAP